VLFFELLMFDSEYELRTRMNGTSVSRSMFNVSIVATKGAARGARVTKLLRQAGIEV
jgi:hypothetical protein